MAKTTKTAIEKARPVLQTANLPRPVEGMVFEAVPVTKGPTTAGANLVLSTGQWLERYGTREELAMFRASIEKRIEEAPTAGMRRLPSGISIPASMVLVVCSRCNGYSWTTPEKADGAACVVCPETATMAAGTNRRATPKELKAWTAKATAAREKFIADGPRRKAELDAFNRRTREDMGPGKNPFAKD